jgi:hypothetical protein
MPINNGAAVHRALTAYLTFELDADIDSLLNLDTLVFCLLVCLH